MSAFEDLTFSPSFSDESSNDFMPIVSVEADMKINDDEDFPPKIPLLALKNLVVSFKLVLRSRAPIFHFHDPELLFNGLILKIFWRYLNW